MFEVFLGLLVGLTPAREADVGNSPVAKTIDLGELAVGTTHSVTITINNTGSEAFSFTGVKVGCKCTKAQVPDVELNPGDSAEVEFEFVVDRYPKALRKRFEATLSTDRGPGLVHLTFNCDLTANLAPLQDTCFSVAESTGECVFEIPFIASKDVSLDDYRISSDGALTVRSTEFFRNAENKLRLRCIATLEGAADRQVCVLKVVPFGRNSACSILCIAYRQEPIEILPSTLTFYQKAGGWTATALAKFNTKECALKQVEASYKKSCCDVVCKKLGAGKLYRLAIHIDELGDSEGNVDVTFEFENDDVIRVPTNFRRTNLPLTGTLK